MVLKINLISCVGLISVLWLVKIQYVDALFDPSLFNGLERVEDARITHKLEHASRKRSVGAIDVPGAISTTIKSENHDVTLTFTPSKRHQMTTLLYRHKEPVDSVQRNKCLSSYEDVTNNAHAIVDTCGKDNSLNMMAEVYIDDETYVILPDQSSDIQTKHGLFKPSQLFYNLTGDSAEPEVTSDTYVRPRATRNRRQTEVYLVELVFVIDFSLYQFWRELTTGTEAERNTTTDEYIQKYYTFLANGVKARYNSLTMYDLNIDVELVGIYVAKTQDEINITSNPDYTNSARGELEGTTLLNDFEDWVANQTNQNFPTGADHYMLMTGIDMSLDGNLAAAGYANTAKMCTVESVSLVDIRLDLLSGVIAAHELGHSLGGLHDGTVTGCSDSDYYILATSNSARTGDIKKNPWLFSTCSADLFEATILDLAENCLLTDDVTGLPAASGAGMGQTLLPDEQCRIILGAGYEMSRTSHNGNYNDMCTGMYCTKSGISELQLVIPSDGTSCGNNKPSGDNSYGNCFMSFQWCLNGDCVFSDDAPSGDVTCLFGDQPSGDRSNRPCASLIATDKSECYNQDVEISCCASCAAAKSSDVVGCEYGDRDICSVNAAQCYGSGIRASCCQSCIDHEKPDLPEDCKYGDRVGNCAQVTNVCANYPTQCCETCNTQTTKGMTTDGTGSNTTGSGPTTQQTQPETTEDVVFTTASSTQSDLPEWIIPVVASVGGVVFLGLLIGLIIYIQNERRRNERNKRNVRRRNHGRRFDHDSEYDSYSKPYDKYSYNRY